MTPAISEYYVAVQLSLTAVHRSFHNVEVCYVRLQRIYSNTFSFKLATYQSFVMHPCV